MPWRIILASAFIASPGLAENTYFHAYRLPVMQTNALSDSSQIAGTVGSFGIAVLWDPTTGLQYVEMEPGVVLNGSFGYDINEFGELAVTQLNAVPQKAFRWSASAGLLALGSLVPGKNAVANGINDKGHVVGQAGVIGGGTRPFFWSPETGMVSMGEVPFSGTARDINNSGVACGEANGVPFIWTQQAGFQPLSAPPGYILLRTGNDGLVRLLSMQVLPSSPASI